MSSGQSHSDDARISVLETKVENLTEAVRANTRILTLVHNDLIIREARQRNNRAKLVIGIGLWTAILPAVTLALDRMIW